MNFLKYLTNEAMLQDELKEGSSIVIGDVEIQPAHPIKPIDSNDPPAETEEQKQARIAAEEEAIRQKEITDPANNTGKVVQIDDGNGVKDYVLDEQGNATLNGEIVFTKEQLESAENDDDNLDLNKDDIHTLISQVSGLELKDENGNPISFKPGVEGLAEREVYIKDLFYKKGLSEATQYIFETNPDIKEMYSYKQQHGSLEGYANQIDFNKVEIDESTTDDQLKSIIKQHLSLLGNDSKYIERFIKMSENEETLRLDALESLAKLKEHQGEISKQRELEAQESERKAIEKYENYYGVSYENGQLVDKNVEGSVYDKIVKSGKIGNIFIPKEGITYTKADGTKQNVNRIEIFNYFYKPVKEINGSYYTQAQLDETNRLSDTDSFLIQGIKNITGNDLKSLEKTMQNIIRVKDARSILKVVSKKDNTSTKLSASELSEKIKKGEAQIVYP